MELLFQMVGGDQFGTIVGDCCFDFIVFFVFFTGICAKNYCFSPYIVLNNLKFLYIAIGFGAIYVIRHIDGVNVDYNDDVFGHLGNRCITVLRGKRFEASISRLVQKNSGGTVISIAVAMIAAIFLVGLSTTTLVVGPFMLLKRLFTLLVGGIGAIAQFGDLYESLIKRTCNAKDSSVFCQGMVGIFRSC